MNTTSTSTPAPRTWPLIVAGTVFLVLGPVIYGTQIAMGQLVTPWYLPAFATVGVVLMMAAFVRRPGVLRGVLRGVLVALALLPTVFAWLVIAIFSRTPEYTGPARVGEKLPTFAAHYADGREFSDRVLATGRPAVLLFYRGHW
ncbi:MAG: hypothetical protein EXS16_11645 [Gemmataceae bacterium]|nr:hypothetical protein [Gemmataceae bacterium]